MQFEQCAVYRATYTVNVVLPVTDWIESGSTLFLIIKIFGSISWRSHFFVSRILTINTPTPSVATSQFDQIILGWKQAVGRLVHENRCPGWSPLSAVHFRNQQT